MTARREKAAPGSRSLKAARWALAAAVVAAVHAGGVWAALHWRSEDSAASAPPAAVMIDLAPLPVAPPAPTQDVAPGPQQTEAQPDPAPDTPPPVPDPAPDPTPPAPTPDPQIKIPDLPKNDDAAAVLAPLPPPRPKLHKKTPPDAREAERKKLIKPDKKKIRQTTAPPTSQARRSDEAAAPAGGASFQSSVSPATWKGELIARLDRYKRYPPGDTASGTASVAFTINRSGQVLSSRLIGSSGDGALDAEAVSLPRRASPLPAPPPGVGGGGAITLAVPVRFGH